MIIFDGVRISVRCVGDRIDVHMRDRNATGRPAGRHPVVHALTAGSLPGLVLFG
jgi:hypothetical protein